MNGKKLTSSLLGLFLLLVGLGSGVFLVRQNQSINEKAAELDNIDLLSKTNKVEYGFNTHVSATGANLDIKTFKRNVDDLVQNKQKWIRFNIIEWETAPTGTPDIINWDNNNLSIYDQAIDYAHNHGLKIFLVVSVPQFAKNYSESDYLKTANNYYNFMSSRYKGKVSVWQIFNEADVHNFRDYSLLSNLTSSYLAELKTIIQNVRRTIKSNDSGAIITTNVSGYPLSQQVQNRWFKYYDVLSPNLDILALDLYPDVNQVDSEIKIMPDRINNIKLRYKNKSVAIVEVGRCTRMPISFPAFNPAGQKVYLPKYLNSIKTANPIYIIAYEIQDENNNPQNCEGSFGIKNYDSSHKQAFDSVMSVMK